jgi:hypothetical protein
MEILKSTSIKEYLIAGLYLSASIIVYLLCLKSCVHLRMVTPKIDKINSCEDKGRTGGWFWLLSVSGSEVVIMDV